MKGIGKRPWFWTALIALVAYFDTRSLTGGWVYDDAGSVIKNVVVNGMVDWKEAFTRDYWGTEMKNVQSHKSFRPITTLTLKANYVLAQRLEKYQQGITDDESAKQEQIKKPQPPPTMTFRIVNFLLHGIVTGLVTKAASYIFPSGDVVSQFIVGTLFAIHPVHAEVVSNVTSRGELLMSIFFLIAFISFAGSREACYQRSKLLYLGPSVVRQQLQQQKHSFWLQQLWGIYLLPWLCMTLSTFSKEHGATTLISLVGWDLLKYHGNLVSLQRKLLVSVDETETDENGEGSESKDTDGSADAAKWERAEARQFVGRTIVLAMQTLAVAGWRYMLNGETSPDFIEAQNPAGFAKDRFTRAFSVTWVYCLYIRDALYPYYLSPDWSGRSIDLVTHLKDPRAMFVVALWYFSAVSFWSMIVGSDTVSDSNGSVTGRKRKGSTNWNNAYNSLWNETTLRQVNIAVWAFTFSPFLLSSNIFVVVGLMKADRVIYLPLFGFCLLEAILLSKFRKGAITMRPAFERRKEQLFWGAHFFLIFQVIILSAKNHERNLAWSHSLRLWGSAYAVNPRSYHTMYNYGYELSLKNRFVEAESVMRPIGSARVDGPSNTFVYTMVLFNLQRCDKARVLLKEAFEVIEEKRREGGPRNTDSHLGRTESNLLVAKAHCTEDPQEKGRVLYKAVETDPSNDYAINLATNFMQKMQQMEELRKGNVI